MGKPALLLSILHLIQFTTKQNIVHEHEVISNVVAIFSGKMPNLPMCLMLMYGMLVV